VTRMKFKPRKCSCLIIKKGRVSSQFKPDIQDVKISSVIDNPIKCLGKWFDSSLSDTNQSKELKLTVTS
jgi:hypothetical protein